MYNRENSDKANSSHEIALSEEENTENLRLSSKLNCGICVTSSHGIPEVTQLTSEGNLKGLI